MSTNQYPDPRTSAPPPPDPPKTAKLDLSISKILGGALAAMTAAALGSRLSVAGTVVGAAIASVIAAVGSAVYTASLKRTQEKVRTVFTGRVGTPGASDDLPTTVETRAPQDAGTVSWAPVQPSAPATPLPVAAGGARTAGRLNWKNIVVGALAAFAIAAAVLTGFELISGHALSGGTGTTITQVSEGGGKPVPTDSASPTAKPTASASPTAKASPTASSTPTSSQQASTTPVPVPVPSQSQATQAPSETPSASSSASEPSSSTEATPQ